MTEPLRIIQLSDCHVSAAPDAMYRGINPRETLEALLPAVADWGPDLVLLTGDLAEQPRPEAYGYLRSAIERLGVPMLAIPGNHDDAQVQRQGFPETAVETPLTWRGGGWQMILLNSAAEGRIEGVLTPAMLQGMEESLRASDAHALVVLHHQPVPTGALWIDRYPLQAPEQFWDIVDRQPQVRGVCWGHIHHAFSRRRGDIRLLGAPSTAANSLPGQAQFVTDPRGAACRWLELWDDGRLETGLLHAA